jgi:hypothetical protein
VYAKLLSNISFWLQRCHKDGSKQDDLGMSRQWIVDAVVVMFEGNLMMLWTLQLNDWLLNADDAEMHTDVATDS